MKYLWQYIFQYTFIIRPLQDQKILLNKKIKSMKNIHKRKNYINKLFVNDFIDKEFKTFYQLQDFFLRPMIFFYFDFQLQLFINFDVSKKFEIDKYIYHVFIDLKHFQNKFFNKKNSHSKKNEMKSIIVQTRVYYCSLND